MSVDDSETPSQTTDVATVTEDEVRRAIREFTDLLDVNAPEGAIHKFLAEHVYFWSPLLDLEGPCPLYSKVRLGSHHETDFAFFHPDSTGAEWHLVEIEPPNLRLFTREGDPSAPLVHALRQVRDWQTWIANNIAYARGLMPAIEQPLGHVFIGRRSELQDAAIRRQLVSMKHQYRAHVDIHSLDRLLDNAKALLMHSPIEVHIPMHALTDRELRSGLPADALAFIQSPVGSRRQFILDREVPGTIAKELGIGPWPPDGDIGQSPRHN